MMHGIHLEDEPWNSQKKSCLVRHKSVQQICWFPRPIEKKGGEMEWYPLLVLASSRHILRRGSFSFPAGSVLVLILGFEVGVLLVLSLAIPVSS